MYSFLKKIMLILLFCLCLPNSSVFAARGAEVIFYPTDVDQAGELAYLRDSVRLMLASRLTSTAGIQPRFEEKTSRGADTFYRVKSQLISNADGVTITALVIKPSSDTPVSFQASAGESAQVMDALGGLVAEIGETLFAVKVQSVQASGGGEGKEVTGFHTLHPDRVHKTNSGFGLSINQDEFISQMALKVRTTERFKSAFFSAQSRAMTAGDIDGDSLDEVLIATNTSIYIYQLRDQRIQQLATISLPGFLDVHALNVADLDGNGLMEMYLSTTRKDEPRSFVLEWHPSSGVKWLHKNVYWYLRPLNIPGEGVVLAGQKSGAGDMLQPGIYRMILEPGGKITGGELLSLPESINLFDFVFADLDGDNLSEVISINRKEQLIVYNSISDLLYTSPAGFGGRELTEGLNIPIRLVVTDFDDDGNHDILIVDNELYSPKIMNKTRLYKNGQVRGLLWDKDGFIEMWHTNLFSNSIVDFQFLSFIGDAKTGENVTARMFIVEPEKGDLLEGFLLGIGGGRLSVYGMEFISKERFGKE